MTYTSFARRYWSSLTGADAPRARLDGRRGRAGYSFWQRYWASFVGMNLPVRKDGAATESAARTPGPSPRPAPGLPAEGQRMRGWFSLPQLPAVAGLRAGDEESVFAGMRAPDGRIEFFVRRSGAIAVQYRVEVVLWDDTALPAVISLRYGTAEGTQSLLVPMVAQAIGPPVSQVKLPGFDRRRGWEASGPVPVDRATAWPYEDVVTSIHAAANEATRSAWREVHGLVNDELAQVILQALG
jgi:hypothetical protein